ncbi:MAG: hypothetical protein R3F41_13350 [Gammaproteobacteria bacterium]|nr:hypothetical protein [Pseudomonadales bacterium]MCP5349086.1 hypothetical protein [Pseudomonadales bacterium]
MKLFSSNRKQPRKAGRSGPDSVALWMVIGMSIGIAAGAALDNIGLGIALGLSLGAGIGSVLAERNKAETSDSGSE